MLSLHSFIRRSVLGMALLTVTLLCACAPHQRTLTPEEMMLQQDQEDCIKQATSMIYPTTTTTPFGSGYFEMCMLVKGHTPEQIKALWY